MTMDELYGRAFQASIEAGAAASARVVVPLVVELLGPTSVIDVGCGSGSWLAEFKAAGVARVVGIDHPGDGVGERLGAGEFVARDLSGPLGVEGGFDLALSLEVAEHLPAARAESFVGQLAALAPAVLFSAAVPHQGGTGHVNEQWPEYWARLFSSAGYLAADAVRPAVWHHPEVDFWYAQNAILYVRPDLVPTRPALARAVEATEPAALARVHPRLYLAKAEGPGPALAGAASRLSSLARSAGRRGRDGLRRLS